jgi:glycosyltransferase involved in cell wall biosynthesis
LLGQGRSFQLLLFGDGPERASLEIAAKMPPLAGHVRVLGQVSTSEMNAQLSRAQAVVVPSLAGEVFGLALAEGMQKALPVIASDLGSLKEVLSDTGLTFKKGDPADLARQISRLLDDPQQAASLGQRAFSRIETQFSYAKMVSGHAEIYRSLLKVN